MLGTSCLTLPLLYLPLYHISHTISKRTSRDQNMNNRKLGRPHSAPVLLGLSLFLAITKLIFFSPQWQLQEEAPTIKSKRDDGSGVMMAVVEEEEIPIPAVITPTRLNVTCSRGFYCNSSNCQPVSIAGYTNTKQTTYKEIQSNFSKQRQIKAIQIFALLSPYNIGEI